MPRLLASILLLVWFSVAAVAAGDDFKREGEGEKRRAKDALEGRRPPTLLVKDWLNTGGKPLALKKLAGKVVILDFWGVW